MAGLASFMLVFMLVVVMGVSGTDVVKLLPVSIFVSIGIVVFFQVTREKVWVHKIDDIAPRFPLCLKIGGPGGQQVRQANSLDGDRWTDDWAEATCTRCLRIRDDLKRWGVSNE